MALSAGMGLLVFWLRGLSYSDICGSLIGVAPMSVGVEILSRTAEIPKPAETMMTRVTRDEEHVQRTVPGRHDHHSVPSVLSSGTWISAC